MLPLTLALLPGFTDLMTAVNNDAAAVAAFSLFIWGSTRMMREGFSLKNLIWVLVSLMLCLFAKRTVFIAVPLVVIPIIFGLLRGEKRKYAWAGVVATLLVVLLTVFGWQDAASWQYVTKHNLPTRVYSTEAPAGEHIFQLSGSANTTSPTLAQSIYSDPLDQIRGQQVTAGAWIWADELTQASIRLYDDAQQILATEIFDIDTTPTFFTISTTIPAQTNKVQLALSGIHSNPNESRNIYLDGIILVPGKFAADSPPICHDPNCIQGTWYSASFENLIRNSSAENAWLSINPKVRMILDRIDSIDDPSVTLSAVLNWQDNLWYFQTTVPNLFRTFWAKFGWGHVPLMGPKPYRVLAFLTAVALLAAIIRLIRLRTHMPWAIIAFFGVILIFIWSAALLRGLDTLGLFSSAIYIPVARYAYPAIIPIALLLNLGWLELSDHGKKWLYIPTKYFNIIYIVFFTTLDLLSFYSIYHFYYIS
jgi:hypothetical protein